VSRQPRLVRLSAVPLGSRPKIAYSGARGYVQSDGQPLPVPSDLPPPVNASLPMSFAPIRGGLLVAGSDLLLQRLTTGERTPLGCWAGYPTISPNGGLTAWATRATCRSPVTTIHQQSTDGGPATSTPVAGRADLVGLLGSTAVVSASPLSHPFGAWLVPHRACSATHGCGQPLALSHAIPGLASAGGVDRRDGVISGQSIGSHGRDGVLVSAHDGEVLWTKPGWHLGRFSGNDTYVAGWRFVDHGQATQLGLFRRSSGRIVRTVNNLADQAFSNPLDATAWEGDQDLLLIAQGVDSTRAIIRVPVHGSLSRATPVVRVALPGDPGFAFSARP
jgi:hypothetical protein